MPRTAESYLREVVQHLSDQIDAEYDPARQVAMAHAIVVAWEEVQSDVSALRTRVMRQAEKAPRLRGRLTRRQMADLLGLTRQRVDQILRAPRGTAARAYGPPLREVHALHTHEREIPDESHQR